MPAQAKSLGLGERQPRDQKDLKKLQKVRLVFSTILVFCLTDLSSERPHNAQCISMEYHEFFNDQILVGHAEDEDSVAIKPILLDTDGFLSSLILLVTKSLQFKK
uniref:Uncharacterized protein n=1 Tax=Romanomermis culicivorax TaxID=13658 RepID=A0A915JFV6_ROMCU